MATTVAELTAVLKMNDANFRKGVGRSQKAMTGFRKQIGAIGAAVAGAFAVSSLISFGKEASKLAGQIEGIAAAFKKLNQPTLLNDLKEATRGTVSELELMQQAVRAENFQVPLNQLATFFKFATDRAIETGESVDYLVKSIIDGIGRKSTLVMDNLGISASALQEEIKLTGDFGKAAANIIAREMAGAGEILDTTATQQQRLNAQLTDMKVRLGGVVNSILSKVLPTLTKFVEGLDMVFTSLENIRKAAWDDTTRHAVAEDAKEVEFLTQKFMENNKALTEKEARDKAINSLLLQYNKLLGYTLPNEEERIRLLQTQISELKRMGDVMEQVNNRSGGAGLPSLLSPSGVDSFEGNFPAVDFGKDPMEWYDDLVRRREEMEYFNRTLEKMHGSFDDINTSAETLGTSVGVMLVSQFDQLGNAIGRAMAGAESGIENLGQAILSNLGNILIMAGLQTLPAGLPLVLAGAALQLGSGIWSGMGSVPSNTSSGVAGGQANVYFQISGQNLVGVLDRNNSKRNLVT